MSAQHVEIELRNLEDKLTKKYVRWMKLFIFITILLVILIAVVILGIFALGQGHTWALISLDSWIIILCSLFAIFILLDLVFYFHFLSVENKRIELEKPKPEFIDGKRVHIYTIPKGSEGGVFSKTYVEIDTHSILRLRYLIIPPDEF